MREDPCLAVDYALTPEQAQRIEAVTARWFPRVTGAKPADLLDMLYAGDFYLDEIEDLTCLIPDHPGEDGALPGVAAMAALLLTRFPLYDATDDVWQRDPLRLARELRDRALTVDVEAEIVRRAGMDAA